MTAGTWLPVLVAVAALAVWAAAVVDFARTDKEDVRTFPAYVWVALLVLGSVAGAALWFLLGRPPPRRP